MNGHKALERDHHAPQRSTYRCATCDARFLRTYDGTFLWKPLGGEGPKKTG